MKKKILLAIAIVAMLICVFAISASAATYTDESGIKYVTNSDGTTAYVADSRSTFSGTEAIIAEKITIDGNEYTVTSVANNAFNGETQLITLYFPSTITKIGNSTFSGCSNIENVYVNFVNLISVGDLGLTTSTNANSDSGYKATINFYDPSEYVKAEPQKTETANFESIVSIGAAAMQGLNVKHLILGENLTSMSKQCFRHSTIETLNMKTTKLTYFYHYAFNACPNLKNIVIKSLPTVIENDYFSQCTAVESIQIDLSKCTSVGGSAFEFSAGCQGGNYNSTTVWTNLEGENIVDLSSMQQISSEAFGTSNVGMAKIIWPRGLTSLSSQAFRKANLTGTIYIAAAENTSLTLNGYTFGDNHEINTVIFGKGVNKIGGNPFSDVRTSNMTVVFLDTVEYATNDSMFKNCSNITVYYKEFSGTTNIQNSTLVQITSGTAANYGACGIYASVVTTANETAVIDKTNHAFSLVDYDNTYCPMNTMGNYNCANCEATKQVANKGTNPVKDGHDLATIASINYANGYYETGKKVVKCNCEYEKEESAAALFVFLGYSTRGDSTRLCVGYKTNNDAINEYNSVNTPLQLGVVAAVNTTDVLVNNNGTLEKANDKVVLAELNTTYSSFDFIINGFDIEGKNDDLALVMCAYVFDGETISYMGSTVTDSAPTITLGYVKEYEDNQAEA